MITQLIQSAKMIVSRLNNSNETINAAISPVSGDSVTDTPVGFATYEPGDGETVYDKAGGSEYQLKIGDGSTQVQSLDGRAAPPLIGNANYSIQVADEFLGGGNQTGDARGDKAIDLQQYRDSGGQVASGAYAFIAGGRSNAASGNDSHAEGFGTESSSNQSHAEGFRTKASNNQSHAEGSNTIASGLGSHSEGSHTEASDLASHAEGLDSKAYLIGQHAQAVGKFAARGDAQRSTLVARTSTTDITPDDLYLYLSVFFPQVPIDTAWLVLIRVVAAQQGMANVKKFERSCLIANDGGTTRISPIDTIGTDQTIGSPGAWSVSISADDTNDALKISVTGEASTNIRWVADIEPVEVSYPA